MLNPSEIEKIRVGKYSISTSLLIRAALQKGLKCELLPEKAVRISDGKVSHFFKGTSIPCNDSVASSLSNNKYFLRRLLREQRIPVPRTLALRNPAAWKTVMDSTLKFPLAVKPVNASHGNGASMFITTPEELRQAVARAFAFIRKSKTEDRVLIEEYFTGSDLRFFVVGNRVVSVLKREPAYVIGNGRDTIRQLINEFNRTWHSPIKYDLPMCPIPIDREVSRCLSALKLNLNSVPAKGRKVRLRWNANVSTGGRTEEVTNRVHGRLKDIAVQVAKLSHLEVAGVDILCKNPTSGNTSRDNICVLEINGSPGYDIHHFPYMGAGRDISTDILNHIFKNSDNGSDLTEERISTILRDVKLKYPLPTNF